MWVALRLWGGQWGAYRVLTALKSYFFSQIFLSNEISYIITAQELVLFEIINITFHH